MHQPIQLKPTNLSAGNSIKRSPWRRGLILLVLAFACFALSSPARGDGAVGKPQNGNTAEGFGALNTLPGRNPGTDNTATGFDALYHNTTGSFNSAAGSQTLFSNTTGLASTASFQALYSTTNTGSLGFGSTAIGYQALRNSTATGDNANGNTATGYQALFSDTTGDGNTADGVQAYSNTTGILNTASGRFALFANTEGNNNTAIGGSALSLNNTGNSNTAVGRLALFSDTTGNGNTAVGSFAMFNDGNPTICSGNTAVGAGALYYNTTDNNIGLGVDAMANNASGSNNIGLGVAAGYNLTKGANNIYIGNFGAGAAESNTIRIGYVAGGTVDGVTVHPHTATFVAGVRNAVVSGGMAVFVNASGQLGINPSSKRFKEDIASMDKKSDAILGVASCQTFHYKKELDPERIPQFGLVAEEVAKVNPDLVARDDKGEIYSVRYEAVNAMLLNEFLKEHSQVEQLRTTVTQQQRDFQSAIAQQQKEIGVLNSALKEQAAQMQKVSAQVALQNSGAQLVADDK